MSDTLDGIQPPEQNQTESYLRAKEKAEEAALYMDARVDSIGDPKLSNDFGRERRQHLSIQKA